MSETRVQKLERLYGKDPEGGTLKECADYLTSIGYKSLALLLVPKGAKR